MRRQTTFLGCATILIAVSGCGQGGPEIAPVRGTVTMDGKPLANAAVVFIPEGGRPAGATTDAEGHYQLNFTAGRQGALPGRNLVRITTMRDPSETEDGEPIPGSPETIPVKYNAESELEFDVKTDGENVANFALVSGGRISVPN